MVAGWRGVEISIKTISPIAVRPSVICDRWFSIPSGGNHSQFCCQFFPRRQAALDHVVLYTISNAEKAGGAETAAGNQQNPVLLGAADKFDLIEFIRRAQQTGFCWFPAAVSAP